MLKDIVTPDSIGYLKYRTNSEVAEKVKAAYEKVKDKEVEDLTLKEISGIAPLFISQSVYCDKNQDEWVKTAVSFLLANK